MEKVNRMSSRPSVTKVVLSKSFEIDYLKTKERFRELVAYADFSSNILNCRKVDNDNRLNDIEACLSKIESFFLR